MSENTPDIAAWWEALSLHQRARARQIANSARHLMDQETLVSLTQAGLPSAAAWWPSVSDGPDGFVMPSAVVEFIDARDTRVSFRLHGAGAPARAEAAARDYFGHAQFHWVEGGGIEGVTTSWTFEEDSPTSSSA